MYKYSALSQITYNLYKLAEESTDATSADVADDTPAEKSPQMKLIEDLAEGQETPSFGTRALNAVKGYFPDAARGYLELPHALDNMARYRGDLIGGGLGASIGGVGGYYGGRALADLIGLAKHDPKSGKKYSMLKDVLRKIVIAGTMGVGAVGGGLAAAPLGAAASNAYSKLNPADPKDIAYPLTYDQLDSTPAQLLAMQEDLAQKVRGSVKMVSPDGYDVEVPVGDVSRATEKGYKYPRSADAPPTPAPSPAPAAG